MFLLLMTSTRPPLVPPPGELCVCCVQCGTAIAVVIGVKVRVSRWMDGMLMDA